jgi:hypothetical protein
MRKNEGLMTIVVVAIVFFALTSVAMSVGAASTPEETCVFAWSDSDGIAHSTNFNIPAGWVGTDVRRHVYTSFMPIDPGAGHNDQVGCQLTGPVNWKGGVTYSSDETYGPTAPKTLPAGNYTFNMEWHGKLDTCELCYTLKRGATPNLTQQRLYPVADGDVYSFSYYNWNWANTGMYDIMYAGWRSVGGVVGEKRAYLRFDLPAGLDAITPEEKCVSAWADSDGIAHSTNFNIPAGLVGTDVWRHVDTSFLPIDPGAGHNDQVGCQLTGPVNWKGGVTWSGETYGPAAPKTLPAGNYTFNMEWHGKLDTCRLCYTLPPVPYSRAVLKLYHFTYSEGSVYPLGVYRVTSSWEEGTDTCHSSGVEETAAPGEPAWVEVDITSLVQQWQAGTPNYGLVVKTTNEHPTASDPDAMSGFCTKEYLDYLDQAKCPVLELSSGTAPLPTPSEPPLKQSVCASFKPRIGDASESKPAEFTIGGTAPQKVSITSHADNFAIMAIPGMKVVYRVSGGKSSGSLTLKPGTYRLSCSGGGAGYHESATVCIEFPVVTGTPPAPTP